MTPPCSRCPPAASSFRPRPRPPPPVAQPPPALATRLATWLATRLPCRLGKQRPPPVAQLALRRPRVALAAGGWQEARPELGRGELGRGLRRWWASEAHPQTLSDRKCLKRTCSTAGALDAARCDPSRQPWLPAGWNDRCCYARRLASRQPWLRPSSRCRRLSRQLNAVRLAAKLALPPALSLREEAMQRPMADTYMHSAHDDGRADRRRDAVRPQLLPPCAAKMWGW